MNNNSRQNFARRKIIPAMQRSCDRDRDDNDIKVIRLSHNPVTHATRIWCGGEPLRPDNPLSKRTEPLDTWVDKLFDGLFLATDSDGLELRFYGSDSDFRSVERAKNAYGGNVDLRKTPINIKIRRNPYSGDIYVDFAAKFHGDKFPFDELPKLRNRNWSARLAGLLKENCNLHAGANITFEYYDTISRDFKPFNEAIKTLNNNLKRPRERSLLPKLLLRLNRKRLDYNSLLEASLNLYPSFTALFEIILLDIIQEVSEIDLTGGEMEDISRLLSLQPTVYFISNYDNVCRQLTEEMKRQHPVIPMSDKLTQMDELSPDYKSIQGNRKALFSSGLLSPNIYALVFMIFWDTDCDHRDDDKEYESVTSEIRSRISNNNCIINENRWTEKGGNPLSHEATLKGLYNFDNLVSSYKDLIAENFDAIKQLHYRRASKAILDILEQYNSTSIDPYITNDIKRRITHLISYSQEA